MDAVRATLDSEGNLIMQTTPLPNTIIPFTLDNDEEVKVAIIALRCCHLNNRFEDYWEARRPAA
jgi:hypothetical protein